MGDPIPRLTPSRPPPARPTLSGSGLTPLRGEALPALVGALLGSWLVVEVSQVAFSHIVGLLMLGTLALVLRRPCPKARTPGTPRDG